MNRQLSHKNPLPSVVLTIYNVGSSPRAALESILHQTYPSLQIIIIDDGPAEDSLAAIKNIIDCRITILQQKNIGKPFTLNKALDFKKGEFWLTQDADDLSCPDWIGKLLRELTADQKLTVLYSGHDLIFWDRQFSDTLT